jgi:hypothetical protein
MTGGDVTDSSERGKRSVFAVRLPNPVIPLKQSIL